jgi:hypothetical protein
MAVIKTLDASTDTAEAKAALNALRLLGVSKEAAVIPLSVEEALMATAPAEPPPHPQQTESAVKSPSS